MAHGQSPGGIELGDLRKVELGARERVTQGVMGRRGGQPEPLPGAPEPQHPGSELLAPARQQPTLQVERAHHPEHRWLLPDGAEGGAQEGEVERGVVCQQRPALER